MDEVCEFDSRLGHWGEGQHTGTEDYLEISGLCPLPPALPDYKEDALILKDYIEHLQKIMAEHGGDLPVVDEENVDLAFPEFLDDDTPCVVICEKR